MFAVHYMLSFEQIFLTGCDTHYTLTVLLQPLCTLALNTFNCMKKSWKSHRRKNSYKQFSANWPHINLFKIRSNLQRAATKYYFFKSHYLPISLMINQCVIQPEMSKNCRADFPRAQRKIFKLLPFSTNSLNPNDFHLLCERWTKKHEILTLQ